MKSKGVVAVVVTLTLIFAGMASLFVPMSAHAVPIAPTVKSVAIPAGSDAVSLASDGSFTYYASKAFGHIFKVDTSANSYSTIYNGTGSGHHWISIAYSTAIYPQKPTLYLIDSSVGTGDLYKFNLTSSALSCITSAVVGNAACDGSADVGSTSGSVWVAPQCQVWNYDSMGAKTTCQRSQSFVYAASGNKMFKVENLKDVAPSNPDGWWVAPYNCGSNAPLCASGSTFPSVASDANGNIYFTDTATGKLFVYSSDTFQSTYNYLTAYSGFTRPTGVAIIGQNAYIAQNAADGGIAVFSLTSNTIASTIATLGTTPFATVNYGGAVAWSSNGTDHKICTQVQCIDTGEKNYYLYSPDSNTIMFGYIGSAGVGEVEGLAVPPITTTSSSTSSSSSTSVSSTTSSTTSATTTTAATTGGGGGGGSSALVKLKCSTSSPEVGDSTPCTATVSDRSNPVNGTVDFRAEKNRGRFEPPSCSVGKMLVTFNASCSVHYTPDIQGSNYLTATYYSTTGSLSTYGLLELLARPPTIVTITETMTTTTNATRTINSTVTQTTTTTETVPSTTTHTETATSTQVMNSTHVQTAVVTQTETESTTQVLTSTQVETSTSTVTTTEEAPIKIDGSMIMPAIILSVVSGVTVIGVKVLKHRH